LQVKKEKNASKEALDATAFAKFFFGPGWRQAGTLLLVFGIPRDNRNSSKYGMNPGNAASGVTPCQGKFAIKRVLLQIDQQMPRRRAIPHEFPDRCFDQIGRPPFRDFIANRKTIPV